MKIPFNEQNTLIYLIEEEDRNLFWGDRLFGNKSKIFTTVDLAKFYKKIIYKKEAVKIFSYFKLRFLILISILSFTIALIISAAVYNKDISKTPYVLTILFMLFIFSLIFWQFFCRNQIFKITLFQDGIIIKGILYRWREICQMYIVVRPRGNQRFYYLILALDTGVIQRYEFTNLMNWNSMHIKLSAYIEHYKNFR